MKMKVKKNSYMALPVDKHDHDICIDFDKPFIGKVHINIRRVSKDQVILSIELDGTEYE